MTDHLHDDGDETICKMKQFVIGEMQMKWIHRSLGTGVMLSIVALTSCSQEPSSDQAKTSLCTAIASYNQAVASLEAIQGGSTVGQLKDAQKQVTKAKDSLLAAAETYQKAEVTELKTSFEKLQKDIKAIPDKATLAQAKNQITPALQSVKAASQRMNSAVQCP